MKLEIKNFENGLDGQHFDKWNIFEPYDARETYIFKARNKPHSEKHHIDCVAVLVEIDKNERTDGTYFIKIAYETYSNTIYKGFHTKKEISNKIGFFRLLTEQIDKYENA